MVAAGAGMAEARLGNTLRRYRNFTAVAGVGDVALINRFVDGLFDLPAGPPQKPLAIAEALVSWIETPID